MDLEEFKEKVDAIEDTAYAEKGHPQKFGNQLLLENIDAFGVAIAELHHKVRSLERDKDDHELRIIGLENEIALLSKEIEDGKKNLRVEEEES